MTRNPTAPRLQIFRSSTPGVRPGAGVLLDGELATNRADGVFMVGNPTSPSGYDLFDFSVAGPGWQQYGVTPITSFTAMPLTAGRYGITAGPQAGEVHERATDGADPVRQEWIEAATRAQMSALGYRATALEVEQASTQAGYTARAGTLTDLLTYNGSAVSLVWDDKVRGGVFRKRVKTSGEVANGGTTFAHADGANLWERVAPGSVTPELFGAVGDGVTNDTTAFLSALSLARTTKRTLLCAGQYALDNGGPIYLENLPELRGMGKDTSALVLTNLTTIVVGDSANTVRTYLHDLQIRAATYAGGHHGLVVGTMVNNPSGSFNGTNRGAFNCAVERVDIRGFGAAGLKFEGNVWSFRGRDISVTSCNKGIWLDFDGIQNAGSNFELSGCVAFNNYGNGIEVNGASVDGVYVKLVQTNSEGNSGTNCVFTKPVAGELVVEMIGCHIEQTATDRHIYNEGTLYLIGTDAIGLTSTAGGTQKDIITNVNGSVSILGGRLTAGTNCNVVRNTGGTVHILGAVANAGNQVLVSNNSQYQVRLLNGLDQTVGRARYQTPSATPSVGLSGAYGALTTLVSDASGLTLSSLRATVSGMATETVTVMARAYFSDGTNQSTTLSFSANGKAFFDLVDLAKDGTRLTQIDVTAQTSAATTAAAVAVKGALHTPTP